ncbi:hypothetical protein B0H14DRAFT_3150643 [Mycena olivaceomarginata]|nr:hypothetical protein B0H14DRAFT_3150643 [Mycena olivaceomarginata]
MSFTLERTHIAGGTFNNVAGNLSQVFNSHTLRHRPSVSLGQLGGAARPDASSRVAILTEFNYVSASRETNHPAVHRLGSARRRSGDVSESQLPHDVPNAALGDADHIPGTVFNSVAGNMTQLNVTSYQISGWKEGSVYRRGPIQEQPGPVLHTIYRIVCYGYPHPLTISAPEYPNRHFPS